MKLQIILMSMLLVGCSSFIGRFSVVSSENIGLESSEFVEGAHCIWSSFGIDIGDISQTDYRIDSAIKDAIKNAKKLGIKANALASATIETQSWNAIFIGRNCIIIKGRASFIK